MINFYRTGTCENCGDCCGANGVHNCSLGWEAIRNWSLSDVAESYSLWTLFGLAYNPQVEQIQPEEDYGLYRVTGKPFYYVWVELRPGKGHLPCKDISATHDGSSYSTECPFLKPDPGNGTRPCALVGSGDEGARTKFCRPEENPEYEPSLDIWSERSKNDWETDHPNCSYAFVEVT